MIEEHNKGLMININQDQNLEIMIENIRSIYNYKIHKYIYISYQLDTYTQTLFSLIKDIKKLSVILIFETKLIKNIELLKQLYAVGVDIFLFLVDSNTDEDLLMDIRNTFPDGTTFFKERDDKNFFNLYLFKKMDFLTENSLLEQIKRKIWIDISNLKRRLRVKEINDSYNSAGL